MNSNYSKTTKTFTIKPIDTKFDEAKDSLARINRLLESQNLPPHPQEDVKEISQIKQLARGILEFTQNASQETKIVKERERNKVIENTDLSENHHNRASQQQQSIDRLMGAQIKKKENVLNLKLQIYQDELTENQGKIKVNPKSEDILKNKNYLPIYLRTEQVLQERKNHIDKLQQERQEQTWEPDPPFQPNLHKLGEKKRSLDVFLSDINYWADKKALNQLKYQQKQISQQMEQSTFVPKINDKSKQILKVTLNFTSKSRIYLHCYYLWKERNKECDNLHWMNRMEVQNKEMQERKKSLVTIAESSYNFVPTINETSQKLALKVHRNSEDIGISSQITPSKRKSSNQSPSQKKYTPQRSLSRDELQSFINKIKEDKYEQSASLYCKKEPICFANKENQTPIKENQANIQKKILNRSHSPFQKKQKPPNQMKKSPNNYQKQDFRIQELYNNQEAILKRLNDYKQSKSNKFCIQLNSQFENNQDNDDHDSATNPSFLNRNTRSSTANIFNLSLSEDAISQDNSSSYSRNYQFPVNQSQMKSSSRSNLKDSINENKSIKVLSRNNSKKGISENDMKRNNKIENNSSQSRSKSSLQAVEKVEKGNQIKYHPNLDFILGILNKNK